MISRTYWAQIGFHPLLVRRKSHIQPMKQSFEDLLMRSKKSELRLLANLLNNVEKLMLIASIRMIHLDSPCQLHRSSSATCRGIVKVRISNKAAFHRKQRKWEEIINVFLALKQWNASKVYRSCQCRINSGSSISISLQEIYTDLSLTSILILRDVSTPETLPCSLHTNLRPADQGYTEVTPRHTGTDRSLLMQCRKSIRWVCQEDLPWLQTSTYRWATSIPTYRVEDKVWNFTWYSPFVGWRTVRTKSLGMPPSSECPSRGAEVSTSLGDCG